MRSKFFNTLITLFTLIRLRKTAVFCGFALIRDAIEGDEPDQGPATPAP